jgi:hypothetical protein
MITIAKPLPTGTCFEISQSNLLSTHILFRSSRTYELIFMRVVLKTYEKEDILVKICKKT